jgi:transmembrane sensor
MSGPSDDRTVGDIAANEQAAAWVVRMSSDQRTRADEDGFEQWLGDDPAHGQAYADHFLLWDGMAQLSDDEEARAILDASRPTASVTRIGPNRRTMILRASAAAAAVAAGAVALPLFLGESYETKAGEQRRIVLADGSSVMLNTQSRVRIAFGEHERHIFLEKGQAYFDVAKDPARPFRVFAGEDEIRAVGTAFDVRLDDQQVRVVLEEGVVALYWAAGEQLSMGRVGRASPSDRPLAVMHAGQQVRLKPASSPAVAPVDIPRSQAWRYGQMILDEALLGEAVEDMNRYGGRRIILENPDMANLRISGVFHTKRPEAFVDVVTAALDVRVAREDGSTIVLAPGGAD